MLSRIHVTPGTDRAISRLRTGWDELIHAPLVSGIMESIMFLVCGLALVLIAMTLAVPLLIRLAVRGIDSRLASRTVR